MLHLVQGRVVGGEMSSLAELRFAKRLASSCLDTTLALTNFEVWNGQGQPPDTLFLSVLGGEDILSLPEGALVFIPSRQAQVPSVAGAVELISDPLTLDNIVLCGGYVFERSVLDLGRRTLFLKLIATFTSANRDPLEFDPEPEALIQGLTWRLEIPMGFPGKVFSGGMDMITWLAILGRLPPIPVVPMLPLQPNGGVGLVAPTPTGATNGGKLGYVNYTDIDGRHWRGSAWKDFQADHKSSINWIRSADRERYKMIAGEFVVKTDAANWTKKLMSYEHVSPCPLWADTICHLSTAKKLNIFGKEDLFFAGEAARDDYSQISWEQFTPKGHVFDRDNSFNSLMLACDGFRIASLFYYGRAWNNVAVRFKIRLESGDLKEFLPEYVNYLAHQGLVYFYSVMTTLTIQDEFVFASEADPAEIFDRCMDKVCYVERFSDMTFWRRYEDQWKKGISYNISGQKRRGEVEVIDSKKKVVMKSFVALGEKEQVCWRTIEKLFNISPLKMSASKFKGACSGKPKCKSFHPDVQGIPFREDFLANIKYCKILSADDKTIVEKAMSVWY